MHQAVRDGFLAPLPEQRPLPWQRGSLLGPPPGSSRSGSHSPGAAGIPHPALSLWSAGGAPLSSPNPGSVKLTLRQPQKPETLLLEFKIKPITENLMGLSSRSVIC